MNTALDAHEIQDILKYVVENNKKLNKDGKKSIAIEVFGEAGCAKSSVVEQVAIESGMPFVKINAAQITVDDFVGYPLKEYKMCRGEECEWVVESAIDTYTAMGFKYSNEHRMGYAIPKWIMGQDKPMIFLIDDYSRASLPVLQAINEVVDRQEYLSWELPKGSTVILTANPDTGDYFVSSTDSAMDTRKLKLEMKFSTEVWASWAEKYGVDSRCINFILKNPEIVEGIGETKDKKGNELKKGNIRIWTKYFDTLSGISSFKDNLGLVMNLGSGSLPAEHVVLFTAFINNGLDEIWSPEELLTGDSKKAIDHLKSVIKDGTNRRQDIAAIVSKRLLNYSTHYKDKFTDKMVSSYGDIMESGYLSQDLLILSLKKICTFPKFNRLAMRPDLIKLLTL